MAATDDSGGPWSGRTSAGLSESGPRESWLCRSTVGAGSDLDEDMWSPPSDEEEKIDQGSRSPEGVSTKTDDAQEEPSSSRSRRLTLGSHFDSVRAHALRKIIPPLPTTPVTTAVGTPHAKIDKKRLHKTPSLRPVHLSVTKKADDELKTKKKSKENKSHDVHMNIYTDYEREEGFGKSPKPREVFVLRHESMVHVALFLSTACVHCVSFNVSPALRRIFRIESLPVGLCIVIAWTILGLVNCVGSWMSHQGDRIMLLRSLSWMWVAAVVLLQLAKILPVASWIGNTLLGLGYTAAAIAHGLIVPNVIAVGAEIVAAKSVVVGAYDDGAERRRQQSVDVAMGAFITRGFGAMMVASSFVQAFYFAAVDLELGPSEHALILRSRRSVYITFPCGTLLLALIVTFLFWSRHHVVSPTSTRSSTPSVSSTLPHDLKPFERAQDPLDRKLAQGDFMSFSGSETPNGQRIGLRQWFQLARRSVALIAIAFFVLLLMVAVSTALVAQPAIAVSASSSSLVNLVMFGVLSLGWVMTMLLSTSQLAPSSRDKLYGHIDDLMVTPLLPSRQQLFVLVALLCLASAAAFAAFVRAQLYSTLFVQTCQLRRPHDSAILFDPNIIGAWVGFASVLLLPSLHFAVRLNTSSRVKGNSIRRCAVRRVVIGVLLYLIAIFLSSVVELYRRASRWPTGEDLPNPTAAGCMKTHASNFPVFWSVPHLVVLAIADALFRVSAFEEAHALTAPLDWLGVAQGVLSFADSVGYASALALTKTLSPWLYQIKSSDLVLMLLLITAIACLSYALTKRLAEHVQASRHRYSGVSAGVNGSDSDCHTRSDTMSYAGESPRDTQDRHSDAAPREEAKRITADEKDDLVVALSTSSRLRLSARTLKLQQAER